MNFNLLRPVVFSNLKVGDKLTSLQGSEVGVTYVAPNFAVLRFGDNSEGLRNENYLEINYGLAPLCWVEGKPVYPGDELYRTEVEGGKALTASHITGSRSGVEYLHFSNVADANEYADNRRGYLTWTKPEQKPVPSFQVEGQGVFPGDTVYYYGVNRNEWGEAHTVKENGQAVWQRTGRVSNINSYDGEATAFRLKPMLVIGDRLVPMPVREPLEEGETYFTPSLYNPEAVGCNTWSDTTHDRACLEAGLIHHTTKAAVAHGEAFRALSKKKD